MKINMLFISIGIVFFLGFGSCGEDKNKDESCSAAWGTELQDEINAFSNAAQAYSASPSLTTCNAYKNAAQAYVNALQPYGECATLTGSLRTNWQTALTNAQASVDAIECDI